MGNITVRQAAFIFAACLAVGVICAYGAWQAQAAKLEQARQKIHELEELLKGSSPLPQPAPTVTQPQQR
ncbi:MULTISPECIES: hypothetical protein [Methylobacterium]|jgi:hypothetical protein|uniref:hypothetical protein n=1 Tax=Methylobacterium TaxID=407 RepID=UPI000B2A34E9|nr:MULTISPECIES: hypothetical protein [Methylobacterium]MBY0258190.1 hypothetical protein [Methylobacterium sp.]